MAGGGGVEIAIEALPPAERDMNIQAGREPGLMIVIVT